MYLKSLNLKGFKSFADRTVMRFEPGLAAIVGPNGSGKSNISDAVLWVLGERNAKSLRGQSMEDVIFSGSSARKPVGVAEVELVLDNSDGTLPVDFSEVSIGRRMYRNGESEYLINGSLVRRMDVLDILHDSGLGSGTNSIISQGNLDSILSSRPEDRRELIEEAAGILKHKERRKKSERKLAQMDAHLDRVNDITAEVERQLKPLERKAKKAITFKQLDAEYQKYRLELAVDDLRILQKRWNEILEAEETNQKKHWSFSPKRRRLTTSFKASFKLQVRTNQHSEMIIAACVRSLSPSTRNASCCANVASPTKRNLPWVFVRSKTRRSKQNVLLKILNRSPRNSKRLNDPIITRYPIMIALKRTITSK